MKKLGLLAGWITLLAVPLVAQDGVKISGKVTSPWRQAPVPGAVVTIAGTQESAVTDSTGYFEIIFPAAEGMVEVWAPGFYNAQKPVSRNSLRFTLVPLGKSNYNEEILYPFYSGNNLSKATSGINLNENNFSKGSVLVDDMLKTLVPGLRVVKGSGMPGEGSFMNARGISTFIGHSSPLVIIDGAPFLPDMSESPIIGGYSPNLFNGLSASDIKNITFLKGAETGLYGSLGSNGVLIIETDDATNLETRISFHGQVGMAYLPVSLPVLEISDYKSYLGGIALTRFEDMGDILQSFPFLKDDPGYYYNYLYNNNTNWQKEIINPAFVTENILKIKGGDAVAKYDLSFGYLNQEGIVENSGLTRYNMRLKSNINVSQKIELFASMSLSYMNNKLHEQGLIPETNPLMAALAKSPLVSPWKKDENNNLLPDYATIRDEEGNIVVSNAVSNPLALVNTTQISNEGSDVIMNGGINYQVSEHLKLTGLVGLYSNYNHSELFIPGVSNGAIMPLEGGLAKNTVRDGIRETFNMYYNLNGAWQKTISNRHTLQVVAGWQALTTRKEFDAGQGRNSSSDFYKTLDYVNTIGRSFYGYIDQWNWMNFFSRAEYTHNRFLSAGVTLAIDGASSLGNSSPPFGLFPGLNLAAHLHNLPALQNSVSLNRLTIRGELFKTGNSYFNSNLSDYFYRNQPFRQLSGIVRANIPNTGLQWENNVTLNLGLDFSGFNHRLDITLDAYRRQASEVIVARDISPVFGTGTLLDNRAEIRNTGVEAAIQGYLISTPQFSFVLGGNIALNKNKVTSLGGESERILELEDGAAMVTREGEPVYSFYGYKTDGVFSTSTEAAAAGITDYAGNPFLAGDIRFSNANSADNQIDDNDRVILGSPDPLFFGSFHSFLQYGRVSLLVRFSYCYGQEAYNALRKESESMNNFGNQLTSAKRRWQSENQQTDMPRAVYGDPMGNSRFSDRWIEDASFLKLKEVTLSYDLKNGDLGIFGGGTLYLTGENLLTFTEYLGYDPEFSYSYLPWKQGIDYGKVPLPATVKLGFKLRF